jgi:hypothetical protein
MQPLPPTVNWHDDYDRGRPDWQPEVLDVAVARVRPGSTGAGTGKLTRLLVSFFESMGWVAHLAKSRRLPLLERVQSLLDAHEYRRAGRRTDPARRSRDRALASPR